MAIKPLDLSEFSKEVAKLNNEAAYRAAASNAYYSCFHYSQPLAALLDDAGGKGVHEQLLARFTNSAMTKAKSIGYQMKQCRDTRVDADYKLNIEFTEARAQTAISKVEKIIQQIDDIS